MCHCLFRSCGRCKVQIELAIAGSYLWWQACRLRLRRIAADTAASTAECLDTARPVTSCFAVAESADLGRVVRVRQVSRSTSRLQLPSNRRDIGFPLRTEDATPRCCSVRSPERMDLSRHCGCRSWQSRNSRRYSRSAFGEVAEWLKAALC